MYRALISITLGFWGWQTNHLTLGLVLSALTFSSGFIQFKLHITDEKFDKIVDLSVLICIGALLILLFFKSEDSLWFKIFLRWLPVFLFPIIVGQIYSQQNKLPISSLFFTLRKKRKDTKYRERYIDFLYLYIAVSIFAASTADTRTVWFYIGFSLITLSSLYVVRQKRFSLIEWLFLSVSVFILGYIDQIAIDRVRQIIEELDIMLYMSYLNKQEDALRSSTWIGKIGSVKLSDGIAMRVKADAPLLLLEAEHDVYIKHGWFTSNRQWQAVAAGNGWLLNSKLADVNHYDTLTVYTTHNNKNTVLAHPNNTFWVNAMDAKALFINPYNLIKIEKTPGFLKYRLNYINVDTLSTLPTKTDVSVPNIEKAAIDQFIEQHHLKDVPQKHIIKRLNMIFQKDYKYTLNYESANVAATPLKQFLLASKSGHCEYFATATVLILRSLGIPARYAVGYSVFEYNSSLNLYIVRKRHAHAWAVAWHEGQWINVDNTPSSWVEYESVRVPKLLPFVDTFSNLIFSFKRWVKEDGINKNRHIVYATIAALILYLMIRSKVFTVFLLKKVNKKLSKDSLQRPNDYIFKKLQELAPPRYSWESMAQWMKRIEKSTILKNAPDDIKKIVMLHYTYRFSNISNKQQIAEELKLIIMNLRLH